MAPPRKYTVKKFAQAVEKYFRSRMTLRETGEEDLDGHEITYVDFAIPPSESDLCIELGMTRETFRQYARTEGYAEVCERAKTLIESWLARELNSRDKVEGIKFNLSCNYGWSPAERSEVELGDKTRETISAAAVPMEEKLALISSVFGEIGGEKGARRGEVGENSRDDEVAAEVDAGARDDGLGGVGYYDDEDSPHGAVDYSARSRDG